MQWLHWSPAGQMDWLKFTFLQIEALSTLHRRNLKPEFSLWDASNVFRPHDGGEIWKRNHHRSFWICVCRKLGQGNWRHRFQKAPFSKCFPSTRKKKPAFSNSAGLKGVFDKAPFSWRISMGDRPNRRNKAAFSNSSGVAWTLPQCDVTVIIH